MKEGRVIRDRQIKAIKTLLKETHINFTNVEDFYRELTDAVVKIVNVRKYKKVWGSSYVYEVDVLVDMRVVDSWLYTNSYCTSHKVRCNRYYRGKIAKIIENEFKYFGFDMNRDELNVTKITYKEIV